MVLHNVLKHGLVNYDLVMNVLPVLVNQRTCIEGLDDCAKHIGRLPHHAQDGHVRAFGTNCWTNRRGPPWSRGLAVGKKKIFNFPPILLDGGGGLYDHASPSMCVQGKKRQPVV